MKPSTRRAFIALAVAVGATSIAVCNDGGEPPELTCPECDGPADLVTCEDCNGDGLVTCFCEGAGRWLVCRKDCEGNPR